MRGLACCKGQNCPYFYPTRAQAHVVTVYANTPATATEPPKVIDVKKLQETDFQSRPDEM